MIKIIVADDHQMFIDGKKALLKNEKEIKVVGEALNGAEVITMLSKELADIVLLDVNMPELDGIEATKRIRDGSANARDPDIPIIAITADVMQENFNACKLAGMNDWITKPVKSAALLESVERWLVHRANLPSNFD